MSKVINISEASSIAIHSMVLIARAKGVLNVSVIAKQTGASRNHLARVMLRLLKDGYVKSTRGPLGGFELNKKPNEISLLNIYESVEGAIVEKGCPLGRPLCSNNNCIMGNLFQELNASFKEYFKKHTLKDFIE